MVYAPGAYSIYNEWISFHSHDKQPAMQERFLRKKKQHAEHGNQKMIFVKD